MEQYLTEFESIVQKRENSSQSIYEGCAYDKLSEVLFTWVISKWDLYAGIGVTESWNLIR